MSEQMNSEKHLQILDAAQKRFAHFGFTKVTMDEIAQDLGIGKASLYYYFPTKESIVREVILREQHRFDETMSEILRENLTAGQKFRLYMERRWVYLNELINLSGINAVTIQHYKPLFGDLYERFTETELRIVNQILNEGRTTGEFTIGDTTETASVLLQAFRGFRMAYLKGFELLRTDSPEYQRLKQEMNLLTELILTGVVARK